MSVGFRVSTVHGTLLVTRHSLPVLVFVYSVLSLYLVTKDQFTACLKGLHHRLRVLNQLRKGLLLAKTRNRWIVLGLFITHVCKHPEAVHIVDGLLKLSIPLRATSIHTHEQRNIVEF